jgi:MFS family permease
MPPEQQTDRRNAGPEPSVWTQLRTDLGWLHVAWMDLVFPRQRDHHPTLGRWRPSTIPQRIAYWLWALLGAVAVVAGYPFVLAGFAVRFYSRRLYSTALALGILGVVLSATLAWTALTVGVYLLEFSREGVLAVAAGGAVAVVSAALATAFARWGGRVTTVLLAYPFGVTAVFLPPVVAALYSPTLGEWVFPNSYVLAVWLLENPLSAASVAEFLRSQFDLVGVAYVGMWFVLAVPVGWALGLLVTLADVVRPAGAAE